LTDTDQAVAPAPIAETVATVNAQGANVAAEAKKASRTKKPSTGEIGAPC
jgi:hypothetical protein